LGRVGKTAFLEVIRQSYSPPVVVLPEAAAILNGSGFPRTSVKCAGGSRAIFHVRHHLDNAGDGPPDD
jgi:hypothetical protein